MKRREPELEDVSPKGHVAAAIGSVLIIAVALWLGVRAGEDSPWQAFAIAAAGSAFVAGSRSVWYLWSLRAKRRDGQG